LPAHPLLPDSHWDVGQRVSALYAALQSTDLSSAIHEVPFTPANIDIVRQIHDGVYVNSVIERSEHWPLPPSPLDAALWAVGGVLALVRQILSGELDRGYALVRPAGHHAGRSRAGGGCVFGNGVLATHEARRLGTKRVLYLDWDAHHGNSQQEAFYADPSVLTISIHQGRVFPPRTAGLDARGEGPGIGTNINVPVPPASGGGVYREVFKRIVVPAAERFAPDFIVVSCGFDGNYIDPSARLQLHSDDYAFMVREVVELAKAFTGGRLIMCHEGGYALAYLPICFLRVLEVLVETEPQIHDPFLDRWGTDFAAQLPVEAEAIIATAESFVADIPA
jgi:acetoin utilization deacetylase AcuC-like enzyme